MRLCGRFHFGTGRDICLEGLLYPNGDAIEDPVVVLEGGNGGRLLACWQQPLEQVFLYGPRAEPMQPEIRPIQHNGLSPAIRPPRPRVFIPVFPAPTARLIPPVPLKRPGPASLVVKNLSARCH